MHSRKLTGYRQQVTGNQKGQSLMELVVVIAVMVIVIGALTFATIASLRNAQFSQNQAQATKLAQQGIERVRTGRDRNQAINTQGGLGNVTSWNGDAGGNGSIWQYQIDGNCGNTKLTPPVFCFFNINNSGVLTYNTSYGKNPDNPNQETLPPNSESVPPFKRAIIIYDDVASRNTQKTVTAVVTWSDFSGSHESRLTTILRKI